MDFIKPEIPGWITFLFLANGFKNRTEFIRRHVVIITLGFQKIDRYRLSYKNKKQDNMHYEKNAAPEQ